MPIKVRKTFDFALMAKRAPQFTANAINDISDILRDDMKSGVARRETISGAKMEPLKSSTVRGKRLKGSATPRIPLLDTGRMVGAGAERGRTGIFVSQRAKKGNLRARITVPQNRQLIGIVHNEGEGDNPKRRFFYIMGVDRIKRPRAKLDIVLKNTTAKIARSAHK